VNSNPATLEIVATEYIVAENFDRKDELKPLKFIFFQKLAQVLRKLLQRGDILCLLGFHSQSTKSGRIVELDSSRNSHALIVYFRPDVSF